MAQATLAERLTTTSRGRSLETRYAAFAYSTPPSPYLSRTGQAVLLARRISIESHDILPNCIALCCDIPSHDIASHGVAPCEIGSSGISLCVLLQYLWHPSP
jgi:hypothetical protein